MVNPYTTEDQERNNLETRLQRDLDERFTYLQSQIDLLSEDSLSTTDYRVPPNYLPNSHPEWSKDAWLNTSIAPSTVSDDNCECYKWFRQLTSANVAETDATALKREHPSSQHSLWAANEAVTADIPRWDGINGTFTLGGSSANYDIACPLPKDIINAGQTYFVTMEIQNSDSTKVDGGAIYCGLWDKTANDWIRGTTFTPTLSIYGATGGRTLSYRVYAETDSGEQLRSNSISVSTAPATLSPDNHVRISFSGAPGFTKYDIYRDDGTNVYHVGSVRNSIDLEFFDLAETGDTVVRYGATTVFPSVTDTAPAAYAITDVLEPGQDGEFINHVFRIRVPTTYDRSSVAEGDQWFRFGYNAIISGGFERDIKIRKIGLSEGFGGWTRSPLDSTAPQSRPTTTSTSGPEPNYPTPDPPDRGGGGPTCVTLDTRIEVVGMDLKRTSVPMRDIERGMLVNYGPSVNRVKGIKAGRVASVLKIVTETGLELLCTKDHKLITSELDTRGTAARHLRPGSQVITYEKGAFRRDIIDTIEEVIGEREVKNVVLSRPHLYIANGFVCHNYKSETPV